MGPDEGGVHIHADTVTREVVFLIFHAGITIEMGRTLLGVVDEGVLGGIADRGVDATGPATVDGVEADGVVDDFIMMVDS